MTINRVLFDFQCEVLFGEYFFSLKTNETISTINDNDDYFVRFNLVDSINRTDNVTAQLHIIQVVVQIISNKGCYIIVGQYLWRLVSLVAITSDADTHMHARSRFLSLVEWWSQYWKRPRFKRRTPFCGLSTFLLKVTACQMNANNEGILLLCN